jgi:CheY-like chemotaxis protein
MKNLSILIIDDEQIQVENLERAIHAKYNIGVSTFSAYQEKDILQKVEYCFFDIAIVDLRMTDCCINGFDVIEKIKTISPYSKVIIVSAFADEYQYELNKALSLGNILGFVDKTNFSEFKENIYALIDLRISELNLCDDLTINALKSFYADLKNEVEPYKKGLKFEYFISMLFGQMGFTKIVNRIKDQSSNEVDLAIRNELSDPFFAKFKPYILIECKNHPNNGVDRNVFTVFKDKVKHTNGLCNLGILMTTGYIKKTAYLEAMRSSCDEYKIVFLSNPEIESIIFSTNKLEQFKRIIDNQIKDN